LLKNFAQGVIVEGRERERMLESVADVPGDHHGVSTNASETENATDVLSVVICCTQVISRRVERGDAGR
jgi:hypothetical protein